MNKKSHDIKESQATRRFPTKYETVDSLEVTNKQPGFVYRWCREDFGRTGKLSPSARGWIPVNHNLGDREMVAGVDVLTETDGLIRKGKLILCKSTDAWKADREAKFERINASKAPGIKQRAVQELERLRFGVLGNTDEKKSKLIK